MGRKCGNTAQRRSVGPTSERELTLAQRIGEFPDVAEAARELSPHSVAFYLRSLAADFHSYYNAERILVDDENLRAARLALAQRRAKRWPTGCRF